MQYQTHTYLLQLTFHYHILFPVLSNKCSVLHTVIACPRSLGGHPRPRFHQGFGPDNEDILPTLREYCSHQNQSANPSLGLPLILEISSSSGMTSSLARTHPPDGIRTSPYPVESHLNGLPLELINSADHHSCLQQFDYTKWPMEGSSQLVGFVSCLLWRVNKHTITFLIGWLLCLPVSIFAVLFEPVGNASLLTSTLQPIPPSTLLVGVKINLALWLRNLHIQS